MQELTELVRRHRLAEVSLIDSNFLVDVRRAVAIARGILQSGTRFRWTFQASTDLLCRMTDEEVKLLGESGVSHIGFGTESASPDVLRFMNKDHQHVADMYEAARKCTLAGIRVTMNLIFGFPGEEEQHRRETLRVMADIGGRFDNVSFSPEHFHAVSRDSGVAATARDGSERTGVSCGVGRIRAGQTTDARGCAARLTKHYGGAFLIFFWTIGFKPDPPP